MSDIVLNIKEGEPKKGDAIHLIELPEIYSEIGGKVLEKQQHDFLKRLPIICYIGNLKHDDELGIYVIQIKRLKTGAFNKEKADWYPLSLFNLIRTPKLHDIVDWFYNGIPYRNKDDFPLELKIFKAELETISRYIIEIFSPIPKYLNILNKELNHLYKKHDPIDILIYVKDIINKNKILKSYLDLSYYPKTKRDQFIKIILKLNPDFSTSDAIALWDLNRKYVLNTNKYISNEFRIEDYLYPGRRKNKEGNKELDERIQELKQLDRLNKFKNDSRFLKEINQDIIEELELTIFDTVSLEEINQILFIFIDKDNNKKFYVEDFYYEFFISNKKNIIENDYIVNNTNDFKLYSINNYQQFKYLNYGINQNYGSFMKGDLF